MVFDSVVTNRIVLPIRMINGMTLTILNLVVRNGTVSGVCQVNTISLPRIISWTVFDNIVIN